MKKFEIKQMTAKEFGDRIEDLMNPFGFENKSQAIRIINFINNMKSVMKKAMEEFDNLPVEEKIKRGNQLINEYRLSKGLPYIDYSYLFKNK